MTLPVLLSLTPEDMRELGFTLGKRKRLAALIELIKEEHRQRGLRHKYVSPRAASAGSLPRLAEEDDGGGVVSSGVASRDAGAGAGAGTGTGDGAGAGAGAGVSTTATATGYVPPVLSLDPQIQPADADDGNPALVQSRSTGLQGGDSPVHAGSTAPVPIAINASGRRSLGGRSHGRTSSSSPSHNAFHMSMSSPGVREPLLVHVREELGSTMTPIFEDNMSFASRESFDSWRRSVEDISRRALSMGDFAPSLPSEFTKDFEAAQEREVGPGLLCGCVCRRGWPCVGGPAWVAVCVWPCVCDCGCCCGCVFDVAMNVTMRHVQKRLKLRRLRRARNEGGGCTQCSPAAKCTLFTLLSTLVIIAALVVIAVVLKPRPPARPPVIGVHLIPLQPSHNHSHHHHRHHRRWIPLQPSHNGSNASAAVWGALATKGQGVGPTVVGQLAPDSASYWTHRAWLPRLQGWLSVQGTVVHPGLRGSMIAAPAS